jgi:glutamate synthase domain-containing protein 2
MLAEDHNRGVLTGLLIFVAVVVVLLVILAIHDLTQKHHAVLRNYPVLGHLRYLLEAVGPELRQYIVTDNNSERPFSRDQRRWIYASAKGQDSTFGFGTDNDLERSPGHIIIRHAAFPTEPPELPADFLPAAKVLGASHGRAQAFRPKSVVNISGMSFGSLSGAAVTALNQGAEIAECLQGTGEGALSPYHRNGGDLVFQIGTAYFGCRDDAGRFDMSRLVALCQSAPVRAIEVKLSQGAKPGVGGLLPGAKVTAEIAAIRGVPIGKDVKSPARHTEFGDVPSLIDFVERVAAATGLPVGIKSAVGEEQFWVDLARQMAKLNAGPDFIVVDGGEGGTGAAPLVFTDHVALPFMMAIARVYRTFFDAGISNDVVFIGSGRLGLPERALLAMALGCDTINVGREAMMAAGCIQAQRCHTGRCPTGVATQSQWLQRGLDPTEKRVRVARYVSSLRIEMAKLTRAAGHVHPAFVTLDQIEILDGNGGHSRADKVYDYRSGMSRPSEKDLSDVTHIMNGLPSPT